MPSMCSAPVRSRLSIPRRRPSSPRQDRSAAIFYPKRSVETGERAPSVIRPFPLTVTRRCLLDVARSTVPGSHPHPVRNRGQQIPHEMHPAPLPRRARQHGGHPGLVLAPGPGLACVKHRRQRLAVSRPSRTRSSTTDRRRSSIRTKALSSRPRRLRRCSKPMRWPSAWTARDAGSTTCSSSVSGAASNTRMWYLHAYETPASLRAGLTCYFQFYNGRRRHSSLGRRTPDVVYFDATSFGTAA